MNNINDLFIINKINFKNCYFIILRGNLRTNYLKLMSEGTNTLKKKKKKVKKEKDSIVEVEEDDNMISIGEYVKK
jgi:hypothetical protein